MNFEDILEMASIITDKISDLPENEKVSALNLVREQLHEISPFKSEPVDFIRWVENSDVTANDYNPNSVAPPEMELLRTSIMEDGYTQPIVANQENGEYIVVDGFHRNRVGKECGDVLARVKGYLPVVQIRTSQVSIEDRMASTIRHNRARGKHKIEAMSDIVIELKRRNWSDQKIAKHLGMDQDEILRLCQITGLAEVFSDQEFSASWDVEGKASAEELEFVLSDNPDDIGEEAFARTVNTSDENRIFHPYEKWECYKSGFYSTKPPKGLTADNCRAMYKEFLSDLDRFEVALMAVICDWKYSCQHYLTNVAMNRIAWLGQAAMCYDTGVSSEFRAGFFLLSEEEQDAANEMALKYLNLWLTRNDLENVTMDQAMPSRQSDIY